LRHAEPPLHVLSEWGTLLRVRDGRLSMARTGDGEAKLARGVSCKTQPCHGGIDKRMRRLLRNPHPAVLVCIPRIWPEPPLATPGFWPQHAGTFVSACDPAATYGSSFVSRRDAWPIPDEDAYWRGWQDIWAGRPVLLVTGSKKGRSSRKGLLSTARSVDVLDAPQPDAWSDYQGLLADSRAWARAKHDPCVVAACGPAATVLCHELGSEGIQALDMGHAAQAFARVSPKELAEV
jgi:hypothetical protein